MKMSSFNIPVIAAAAMAVVGATPAGPAGSTDPSITIETPTAQATVLVRNHNWLDVEVVALTDAGKRFRLGEVPRGLERTFNLPSAVVDGTCQFRLKIYSIDRQVGTLLTTRYLGVVNTQPISATAGSELVLQVVDPLGESFIGVAP